MIIPGKLFYVLRAEKCKCLRKTHTVTIFDIIRDNLGWLQRGHSRTERMKQDENAYI